MLGLVRGGAGLALIPRIGLAGELERGGLVEVFPERHARTADIFVLMPSRKRVPKRLRLLIDGLKAALAEASAGADENGGGSQQSPNRSPEPAALLTRPAGGSGSAARYYGWEGRLRQDPGPEDNDDD